MGVRNALLMMGLVLGLGPASGCDKGSEDHDNADGPSEGQSESHTDDGVDAAETSAAVHRAAQLEGFVVLADDTLLYRRPSPDAPRLALRIETGHATFSVASVKGEWIQLRSLSVQEAEQHCIPAWAPLNDFDVTLWVERKALSKVTRHSVLAKADKGASAMLAAGTPLHISADERGDRRYRLALLDVETTIHEDSVGDAYQPGPLFTAPEPKRSWAMTAGLLRFDGRDVNASALRTLSDDPYKIAVYDRKSTEAGSLLTVASACTELRLPEPAGATEFLEDVKPPAAPTVHMLGVLGGTPEGTLLGALAHEDGGYSVPVGSKIFWPDGDPAGVVRNEHTFTDTPSADSDKRCFEFGAGTSKLCFRADDLERIEPLGSLEEALRAAEPGEIAALIEGEGGGVGGVAGGVDPADIAELLTPEEIEEALDAGGLIAPEEEEPEEEEPEEEEPEEEEPEEEEPEEEEPEEEEPEEEEPEEEEPEEEEPEEEEPSSAGGKISPVSVVRLSSISVSGSLGKPEVRSVAKRHRSKVRRCFRLHGSDGSLKIALTISPGGTVNIAKVKSNSAGSKPLADCVLKAARTWSFPKPTGGGMAVARIQWSVAP